MSNPVESLKLQFSATYEVEKMRRLIQQVDRIGSALNAVIKEIGDLQSAGTDSDAVESHELAGVEGLGEHHTVNGLEAGQVLKATGETSAEFAKLAFSEMDQVDPGTFASILNGSVLSYLNGYFVMRDTGGFFSLSDPAAEAILTWDDDLNVFRWRSAGYGISINAGNISVDLAAVAAALPAEPVYSRFLLAGA